MAGTTIQQGHREYIWDYFYRGILSFVFSAAAFGDEELFRQLNELSHEFARQPGEDFSLPRHKEGQE
jgi:hypothetical protein